MNKVFLFVNNALQFSLSVMSSSLRTYGLQHARLPCPSPTPRSSLNSCPLGQWGHPTILSSVVPFSSFLQPFPALGAFLKSQFFTSGGQSIGVSDSASVLSMNIQDWFPLGLTSLISSKSKRFLRVFPNTTVQKHQFFSVQPSLQSNFYIHTWLLEKVIALTRQTFVSKVMTLHFKMLLKLVIGFLSRGKHLLISLLQSPSAVILEPPQNKICHCFYCFPIYLTWSGGTGCHDLCFLNVEF